MIFNEIFQFLLLVTSFTVLAKPLGLYIARVFEDKNCGLGHILSPIEKFIYWICRINRHEEMNWKTYAVSLLLFNVLGLLLLYLIQRCQFWFPFNPARLPNVSPSLAFNTAASYVANTNWQAYSGESTLSYLTQMLGLTVQNFVSAATGLAVVIALIRGIVRRETTNLGNFWVDLVRGTLYVLLPLAIILAILLASQGVIQNLHPYLKIQTFIQQHFSQTLPMGPVASQTAITQLGSNGGGFFGVNESHPFGNPTPFSNFLEVLAIILIPASLCFTFGAMIKDKKQGLAIFIIMLSIFLACLFATVHYEQQGNPMFSKLGIEQTAHDDNLIYTTSGGNMEGKEVRFGIGNSATWSVVTTAVSNGSVNSMLDSYTPIGSLMPMWLMQLGEIIYGGVGSGLYGMILFIILTVFIAGLMVGRTPEYLGKKIEIFEMKMACLAILVPHILILLGTALTVSINLGHKMVGNPGAHGFSEILYAFSSTANNNGSALAGLNVDNFFYNLLFGLVMLFGRFWIILPVLAIAGSLASKKIIPASPGTMPTHTPLFICLVVSIILIIGALTFFPSLALGPIVEHLTMINS